MSRSLYSFATSENPDSYINALSYAVDYHNIDKYYIVVISDHDYESDEEGQSNVLASSISSRISDQLKALSEGAYICPRNKADKEELRNKEGTELYKKCLNKINSGGISSIVIPIGGLGDEVRKIAKSEKCLFDLSALKNNLLVDVVSILLSINYDDVYSFELIKKQTYSQDDLFHNLKRDDYKFRKLTDSLPVKESMSIISQSVIRARTIFVYTGIIALVFIPLSIYVKDTVWMTALNTSALVASIGSYLYLFINERK